MEKPEKKAQPPAYNWNEIEKYIETKYNVNLKNSNRNGQGERENFWH